MGNKTAKRALGFAMALFLVFVATIPASAAINSQINFQGKITNPDGTNIANGSYSIVFSLYNVSSAGTAIWAETDAVTVTDGVFQVNLGASCPFLTANACNSNTPVDFNNSSIFLGIKVGADAEMTPRVAFTASPYAFNSDKVGGLTVSQLVQLSPGTQQTGSINVSGSITTAAGAFIQGAPTASATASLVQIGSAIAGGNAAVNGGTYLGLNAPATGAGSAADFLNFQANGIVKLKLDNAGNTTQAGTIAVQGSGASSITGTLNVGGATTLEKLAVGGAMALQETVAPTGTTGYGKLYVNSTDHAVHFVNNLGTDIALGSGGAASTHSKSIQLTAEYSGSILDAAGDTACATTNTGVMSSGQDTALTGFSNTTQNYYKWTTSAATNQCYDVMAQIAIPSDWQSWATNPVTINANTTAGAAVNLQIVDGSGTIESGFNYLAVTPGTASTWTATNPAVNLAGSYTAGGYMTVRVRLTSPTSGIVKLGTLKLNYTSAY